MLCGPRHTHGSTGDALMPFYTLLCTRELDEALTVAQIPPSWSFVSAAVTSRLQAVACMRLIGQAQSIVFWCDTNYVLYLSYYNAYTSWL